jgi:outer membrane protein TolC
VESENLLELNRNTLGNVLNLAPNTPFQIVEPPDYPTTLPAFEDLLARAYSQREDLRVREIAIEQDIARRDQVIGQYAPRVTAQFDSGRSNTTGSLAQRNHDWQATVSVSVPFFTGGQREIDLLTAKEQIAQTKLARELAAEGVESEVKQAWLLVRSLQQTLKALHAQVVAAEQGYHDLDIQYRQGTATSVDVLTTLNDLNTARKDLTVETYAYQIALRNLEQVTGIFQQERVHRSKLK